MAFTIERQRRRVRHIRHERFPRAVGANDKDRDRRLLPARSAEGDVEIAVTIEGGIVDLMDTGDQRRPDLDVRSFARQLVDPDGGGAPLQIRRHNQRQRRW
jgi:hypothetical protein